jgi:hypothetical protein
VVSDIFTKNAVMAVYELSSGLPRIINVLCDNALVGGFAAGTKPVDADTVRDIGRDFDFGGNGAAAQVADDTAVGHHLALAPGPSRRQVPDTMPPSPGAGEPDQDGGGLPSVARAITGEPSRPYGADAPKKRRFLFF